MCNAIKLYFQTLKVVGKISHIFTDENSCYSVGFKAIGVSYSHTALPNKSETHMIEAVNSSIRDCLARFNRRSKRFSKSIEMLDNTLLLFFHVKTYAVNNR
jgi:IS1 family transposase